MEKERHKSIILKNYLTPSKSIDHEKIYKIECSMVL